MTETFALLALTLSAAAAAAALWRRRRRRARSWSAAGRPSPLRFPHDRRAVIAESSDLDALYRSLGYSATFEAEASRLLGEMKALIRAEIPDFEAFQQALRRAEERLAETAARGLLTNDPAGVELLHRLLRARRDRAGALRLLNRSPITEQTPFLERIPIVRDGALSWRSPSAHAVIRKSPRDPERFLALLDALQNLVRKLNAPDHGAAQSCLEAVDRLRRDLDRTNAYIPTSLLALESRTRRLSEGPASGLLRERKQKLDDLLDSLLTARRACEASFDARELPPEKELAALVIAARRDARTVVETPWMHVLWLRDVTLANLLDTHLLLLAERPRSSVRARLQAVREEIAGGFYDPEETLRRLRDLEEAGFLVNSLALALLRTTPQPSLFEISRQTA